MILIMLSQCYVRQDKQRVRPQVHAERLYALANDAFVKIDKSVTESQLVGLMRENPNTFQAAVHLHWLNKI